VGWQSQRYEFTLLDDDDFDNSNTTHSSGYHNGMACLEVEAASKYGGQP
jgi:hypothetical protein